MKKINWKKNKYKEKNKFDYLHILFVIIFIWLKINYIILKKNILNFYIF